MDQLATMGRPTILGSLQTLFRSAGLPTPDLNRSSNVLECLCAAVDERCVETVLNILMHTARYANTSGCRDFLKPGCDVEAIA